MSSTPSATSTSDDNEPYGYPPERNNSNTWKIVFIVSTIILLVAVSVTILPIIINNGNAAATNYIGKDDLQVLRNDIKYLSNKLSMFADSQAKALNDIVEKVSDIESNSELTNFKKETSDKFRQEQMIIHSLSTKINAYLTAKDNAPVSPEKILLKTLFDGIANVQEKSPELYKHLNKKFNLNQCGLWVGQYLLIIG
jgi:predicted house-cleaning noncanonical NTP pyrophosphatase (MazG superfamily)